MQIAKRSFTMFSQADSAWLVNKEDEAALLAAMKGGIERAAVTRGTPEIGDVPFSSERQLMAIFHRCVEDGKTTASLWRQLAGGSYAWWAITVILVAGTGSAGVAERARPAVGAARSPPRVDRAAD